MSFFPFNTESDLMSDSSGKQDFFFNSVYVNIWDHLGLGICPQICGHSGSGMGQHVFSLFPFLSTSDEKKNNVPQDFDIDMDDPETQRAAVAIQCQFRKFQKKKQDVKS
ncbi:calmodulin regulator protein PCP4a isoform X1 [Poecilia latipinna]|uniref:calmodulin regulator protein PCP4a isoform X1 n=1 Tax=Poecilia latipinna TaxID=48699 RepID=UPI00072D94E7|nr:PREDICTED: uncharacterized protein LOC106951592 isoform X1 [Poecilia latipinna]XP_016520864.1 PREDICTED: uncharacterized protein LOC107834291 isoform X1 [Poecilia formosa]